MESGLAQTRYQINNCAIYSKWRICASPSPFTHLYTVLLPYTVVVTLLNYIGNLEYSHINRNKYKHNVFPTL